MTQYTENGLPIVDRDVIKLIRDLDPRSLQDLNYLKQFPEELRENPHLALFLKEHIEYISSFYGIKSEAVLIGLSAGIKIAYESLYKQFKKNKLEKKIEEKE